ncbi:MAG: hypothetical protein ACK4F8_10255 [Aquabacterium sp.]
MKQESKVGLQGTYTFNDKLSATGPVVGRGVDGIKADVEWAYLSYEASPNWGTASRPQTLAPVFLL